MAYDLSEVKVKDGNNWSSPKEIHKITNDYYLYAPVGASGGLAIKDGVPYQVTITSWSNEVPTITLGEPLSQIKTNKDNITTKVSKTGDTMTGSYFIKENDIDRLTSSSSAIWSDYFGYKDKNNRELGQLRPVYGGTNSPTQLRLRAFNTASNGSEVTNEFGISVDKTGKQDYIISNPANFREALGLNQATLSTGSIDSSQINDGDMGNNGFQIIADTKFGVRFVLVVHKDVLRLSRRVGSTWETLGEHYW